MIQLTEQDGRLHCEAKDPEMTMLMCFSPYGEPETPNWPDPDRGVLARCLYDHIEVNDIMTRTFLLPDGKEFDVDAELAEYEKNKPKEEIEY